MFLRRHKKPANWQEPHFVAVERSSDSAFLPRYNSATATNRGLAEL
jgi:hypothetical protein